jgi:hypothetical protein
LYSSLRSEYSVPPKTPYQTHPIYFLILTLRFEVLSPLKTKSNITAFGFFDVHDFRKKMEEEILADSR